MPRRAASGLIESDWNLKEYELSIIPMLLAGLIESDWNLKGLDACGAACPGLRINRIRLEFKVRYRTAHSPAFIGLIESDWNLKEEREDELLAKDWGLIESDWNLKGTGSSTFRSYTKD